LRRFPGWASESSPYVMPLSRIGRGLGLAATSLIVFVSDRPETGRRSEPRITRSSPPLDRLGHRHSATFRKPFCHCEVKSLLRSRPARVDLPHDPLRFADRVLRDFCLHTVFFARPVIRAVTRFLFLPGERSAVFVDAKQERLEISAKWSSGCKASMKTRRQWRPS
jgi:hypothetical protein